IARRQRSCGVDVAPGRLWSAVSRSRRGPATAHRPPHPEHRSRPGELRFPFSARLPRIAHRPASVRLANRAAAAAKTFPRLAETAPSGLPRMGWRTGLDRRRKPTAPGAVQPPDAGRATRSAGPAAGRFVGTLLSPESVFEIFGNARFDLLLAILSLPA